MVMGLGVGLLNGNLIGEMMSSQYWCMNYGLMGFDGVNTNDF